MTSELAGRAYARVYGVSGKAPLLAFLAEAVSTSGAELLFITPASRAPVFLGIETRSNERLGLLCYPFRCTVGPIKGRAYEERRIQIRYGAEETWGGDHRLGVDVAGVDTTLVLGIDLKAGIFIGLDPALYDPLPMGISVEYKLSSIRAAVKSGWTVWERDSRPGRRRGKARSELGIETLVAFRPKRLLDFARFERYATGLGLDSPLRYKAAEKIASAPPPGATLHKLEEHFDLTSREILEIITQRQRLEIAVRGGVAEHHLQTALERAKDVRQVAPIDQDAQPDFRVVLTSGRRITVECKNVSPIRRSDGTIKVEVQKTRASKGDPKSRFYRRDQFDVVAASLWPVTGRWEYRFKATRALATHRDHSDRVAPLQVVDDSWAETVSGSLG